METKPQHHKRCFEDHKEYCVMAEDAADAAVKKVFAILGVDIDNPKEVEAFREDLRFGKTLRIVANKFLLGVVGAAAIGLVGAIWYGIQGKLGVK